MPDQSQKCVQKTLWDIDSVIGSAGSQVGQRHSGLQESQSVEESGQKVFPVNPYRVPVNSEVRKMNGTFGLNHTVSSASVVLQSSLANSLAANLDVNGSMEFHSIWKNSVMPSARQICQLRASGHRTSGNGSIGAQFGWPTPAAQNATGGINPHGNTGEHFTLQTAASMTGWPTPTTVPDAPNMSENRGDGRRQRLTPQSVAGLVGWPTPRTVTGGAESAERKQELGRINSGGSDLQAVALMAGWGTPRVTTNGGLSQESRALVSESRLEDQVQGWATPSARDWKDTPGMSTTATNPDGTLRERLDQLPRQTHGAIGTPCCAETERSGVLEPMFARWLQGFPESWDRCSPNWSEWEWTQNVLDRCGSGSDGVFLKLAGIVSEDYVAMAIQ
jgi:hypothetical protein